jgi:hypothetical protein
VKPPPTDMHPTALNNRIGWLLRMLDDEKDRERLMKECTAIYNEGRADFQREVRGFLGAAEAPFR